MEVETIALIVIVILLLLIVALIILLSLVAYFMNEKINRIKELFYINQAFKQKGQKLIDVQDKLKSKGNSLRIQYSLLLYSNNNANYTNNILLLRMIMLKKIVNLLLSEIVRIHKDFLRKTKKKYLDILKPESNKKKFFIIHCCANEIEGVPKKHVNIIIDWLAHIHDYASSKIHLCNIKGLPELFKLIANNLENLDKQEITNKKEEKILKKSEDKFEKFKTFICNNENFTQEELLLIKNLYNENQNKEYSLKNELRSISYNNNKITKLNNMNNELNKIINDFDYGKDDEYSIEYIFEHYKLNFDQNSSIYQNKRNNIKNHYRFQKSYKNIIDIDCVKSLTLEKAREEISKLVGNGIVKIW